MLAASLDLGSRVDFDSVVGSPSFGAALPGSPPSGGSTGMQCGPVTGGTDAYANTTITACKRLRHRFAFCLSPSDAVTVSFAKYMLAMYDASSELASTSYDEAFAIAGQQDAASGFKLGLYCKYGGWQSLMTDAFIDADTWYVADVFIDFTTAGTGTGSWRLTIYAADGETAVSSGSGTFNVAADYGPVVRVRNGLALDSYGATYLTAYIDANNYVWAHADDGDESPGPVGVAPYEFDTEAGTGKLMVVCDRAADVTVEYGECGESADYSEEATLLSSTADDLCHVFQFTGLESGTRYSYRVTIDDGEHDPVVWTRIEDHDDTIWSFYIPALGEQMAIIAHGDTHGKLSAAGGHRLHERTKTLWASNDSHPVGPARVRVWTGDLLEVSSEAGRVAAAGHELAFVREFYSAAMYALPYAINVLVPGSHDIRDPDGSTYNNVCVPYMPYSETLAEHRVGDWSFFAFNSMLDAATQIAAIPAAVAASDARFKAIVCHDFPIGGDGNPGSYLQSAEITALMTAATQGEVDAILCGHSHRGVCVRSTRNSWSTWVIHCPRAVGVTADTHDAYDIDPGQQASEQIDATSHMAGVAGGATANERACRGWLWLYSLADYWGFRLCDCDDPSHASPTWKRKYGRMVPK